MDSTNGGNGETTLLCQILYGHVIFEVCINILQSKFIATGIRYATLKQTDDITEHFPRYLAGNKNNTKVKDISDFIYCIQIIYLNLFLIKATKTAEEIGIFEALADSRATCQELATKCNVPETNLVKLLDALCALKLLKKTVNEKGKANYLCITRYSYRLLRHSVGITFLCKVLPHSNLVLVTNAERLFDFKDLSLPSAVWCQSNFPIELLRVMEMTVL